MNPQAFRSILIIDSGDPGVAFEATLQDDSNTVRPSRDNPAQALADSLRRGWCDRRGCRRDIPLARPRLRFRQGALPNDRSVAAYQGLLIVAEVAGQHAHPPSGLLRQSLKEEQAMAQWIEDHLKPTMLRYVERYAAGDTAGR